jgi:hypothetical protein
MTTRTTYLTLGALAVALGACTVSPQAPANQPTAGSTGSITAGYGAAPTISPNDPAYSENGAPRAGQPSGQDTAGAPSASGNYAPLQHQHDRGGPLSR